MLALDDWYKALQAKHPKVAKGEPFFNELKEINSKKWCIENSIQIFNHGKKILNFAEAMILIYGAGMSCFENKDSAWKRLTRLLVKNYEENNSDNMDCFRVELDKFQPRSPMLLDFNPEEIDAGGCEEIVDNTGFSAHIIDIEAQFGSLNDLTCGSVSEASLKKFLLSIVVLSSKKVQDHTDYITTLADEAKKMLDDAYNCVKKRMFSRGDQWSNPTVATTTKTSQTGSSSTNSNSKSSDNQGSSDNAPRKTGEQAYFYNKYYDVYEINGKKMFYTSRWIEYKNF